ncbi:MAG: insulinase family protein [Clostridiales bacterium]|nr:insulinase family protein [Clostridiales bacterium]
MYTEKYCSLIDEVICEEVMPNGLKVIFIPKRGFSKQIAIYATDYGSNDVEFYEYSKDTPVKTPAGIAHFLEHKLFEEESGINVMEEFVSRGAQPNAFTNNDNTAYYFISAGEFYDNLELLLGYVGRPYFTDENVEKEKGIIAQEIRMYDDEPKWKCLQNLLSGMYHVHPVRNDIAGTVEDIMSISKELLYTCYNNFYNPGNMRLIICGDLDAGEVMDYIRSRCEHDKRALSAQKVRVVTYDEPVQVKDSYVSHVMDVSRDMVMIGYKDTVRPESSKDYLHRMLVSDITMELFAGRSSRLYSELYKEGLTDSTYECSSTMKMDYSFVTIESETVNTEKFVSVVSREVKRVKEEGFDKSAFERIKKMFIGDFVRSCNSVEGFAVSTMRLSFCDLDVFDYYNEMANIEFCELSQYFEQVFTDGTMAVSVIKSKNNR